MSDKTEAPTSRRISDAREEGQVVRSLELNAAVIILVSVFLLRGPGRSLSQAFIDLMTQAIRDLPHAEITDAWLKKMLYTALVQIMPPVGMILMGLLAAGVAITIAQTGFLWSSKRIGFDFKRINPINGFKRLFSKTAWIEMLKALLKLGLIGWTAYSYLQANYLHLVNLAQYEFRVAVSQFADIAISLMLRVGMTYFLLAAADYAYQRWDFMRNLRMTKQEIKEEFKRSEGDPFLKSRIRSQQRRMARSRMMSNVPKATVIVTNPTHLAIAVEYRSDMAAPKILAKGAYKVAERIVAIARKNNIPIVQNIPLAWAIYKTIDIDQEISPDLYKAMAEILAYVYRVRGKSATTKPLLTDSLATENQEDR